VFKLGTAQHLSLSQPSLLNFRRMGETV